MRGVFKNARLVMKTKEERRKQAKEQAERYRELTGKGPGFRGYIDAFFYGYFNHAQSRSDGIESDVIGQFEQLLDSIEEYKLKLGD